MALSSRRDLNGIKDGAKGVQVDGSGSREGIIYARRRKINIPERAARDTRHLVRCDFKAGDCRKMIQGICIVCIAVTL